MLSFYLFLVFLKNVIYCLVFQGLLEGVGHPFTRNFHFIDSVKAYLSYALLRTSVSPSRHISGLHIFFIWFRYIVSDFCFWSLVSFLQYATGIFVVLLLRFRESLKVCLWSSQVLTEITSSYSVLYTNNFYSGWNRHLLSLDSSPVPGWLGSHEPENECS